MAMPGFTMARFGKWDALLATPRPEERHRYLNGVWHYTRGLALVRTDRSSEAAAELDALAAIAGEPAAQSLGLSGGVATASLLLRIGHAHLAGELAAARHENDAAVASLEAAVALQDDIPYMEPPPWYFPTRQALGAVLLDAGRAADAEAVYRKDLEQYPANGWSLFGLAQSLRAQPGKEAETAWAAGGFEAAWAQADVELTASRF
jgi:tetratricopeptide (TPR) repeat protein